MSTDTEPLLKVRGLKIGATIYPPGERPRDIGIVHGVDFDLDPGKVLGLIGESGAGKSTIGLHVSGGNIPALRLYESYGYEEISEQRSVLTGYFLGIRNWQYLRKEI